MLAWALLAGLQLAGENWSGTLVDADCYASLERNRPPNDTLSDVNRDRATQIRYCRPTAKTKSFALVDFNGQSKRLDSNGSDQARQLLSKRANSYRVIITGKADERTIHVDSINPGQ